jgi:hypothetical protein
MDHRIGNSRGIIHFGRWEGPGVKSKNTKVNRSRCAAKSILGMQLMSGKSGSESLDRSNGIDHLTAGAFRTFTLDKQLSSNFSNPSSEMNNQAQRFSDILFPPPLVS